jgi:hypothetical protein
MNSRYIAYHDRLNNSFSIVDTVKQDVIYYACLNDPNNPSSLEIGIRWMPDNNHVIVEILNPASEQRPYENTILVAVNLETGIITKINGSENLTPVLYLDR